MPPEIVGLPTWMLNGLSISGLVLFIIVGLSTSRLWTKQQVELLNQAHAREVGNIKERYELHIRRTVELYEGRVTDAVRREQEWHAVADKWQEVARVMSDAIEPMQEQSLTALTILQTWQGNRQGRRT